ncbi:hypothetical protein HRG_013060 [Hirsutella rhossiliensis]
MVYSRSEEDFIQAWKQLQESFPQQKRILRYLKDTAQRVEITLNSNWGQRWRKNMQQTHKTNRDVGRNGDDSSKRAERCNSSEMTQDLGVADSWLANEGGKDTVGDSITVATN